MTFSTLRELDVTPGKEAVNSNSTSSAKFRRITGYR